MHLQQELGKPILLPLARPLSQANKDLEKAKCQQRRLEEADEKKPKPYPLTTCVVSDEKIGGDSGMEPYVFVHEGREVKLCCKPCLKDFNKDKAKYIAKIEAAEKKAK